MNKEITDNSPIYKFLLATFRANPDIFIGKLLKSNLLQIEKDFKSGIKEIARHHVDLWMMPHFNDEVTTSYEQSAFNKWESIHNEKISSPFEFLKRYVEDLLIMHKDMPCFKINKTNIWNALTFQIGEDLFIATLYADNYIKYAEKPTHFQWNYILHSNHSSLNSLIKSNKLVENHYHLFGSSPNVDLSWIYLMNNPLGQEKKFREIERESSHVHSSIAANATFDQKGIYTLIKIAAYIRLRLFEECCFETNKNSWNLLYVINKIKNIYENKNIIFSDYMTEMISVYKFQSLYRTPDNDVVDYAIINFSQKKDKDYLEIAGERHFLYSCLKKIYKYDKDSIKVQALFYLYLLIKGKFGSIFIQRNNKYGFDNFSRYQSLKFDIIRNTFYQDIAVKMALGYNIKDNNIEKLEARISPQDNFRELFGIILYLDKNAGIDKKRYFYVMHFGKNKKMNWGTKNKEDKYIPQCRENTLRQKIKQQAGVIEKFRNTTRDASFRLYGIDAASHEVNCRPENFGQVFRYLSGLRQQYPYCHYDRNKNHLPDLHKTYHVGEDFYDIIDGLRSIDEAVLFLQLKFGDRIGHGVALGLNPEIYYNKRRIISMPLQNALDNIAWCLYCIEKCGINISTSFLSYLQFSFNMYFNRLYNENINKITTTNLLAYISAWKHRGNNPECYKYKYNKVIIKEHLNPITEWEKYNFINREKYKNIDENIYELYRNYHFNYDLKKKGQDPVEIVVNDDYIQLVKELQKIMRNFILKKGVAIESNPSSNFRISNLEKTNELPIFNLFPVNEEEDCFRLNTSVNTDDQGVFYTSLVKEYTLLCSTLQNEFDTKGMRIYSDDKILSWISHLIENGKQQCFMQEN